MTLEEIQQICFSCDRGGNASWRSSRNHPNRHACDWHGAGQSCKNPLRHDKVCPYSPRDAADRCDPDHFMTRVSVKGAVA